jgi:hypothetical protein
MDRWVLVACFRSSVAFPLYFPLGAFAEVKRKFVLAGTVQYIGARQRQEFRVTVSYRTLAD